MLKKKPHHPSRSRKVKPNALKKEIVKHVKEDVRDFKEEISRDKSLLKRVEKPKHNAKHHVDKPKHKKDPKPHTKAGKREKVKIVMKEFKAGKLRSGSKHGPEVTNPKQALAIALHEAGMSRKKPSKKRK